MRAMILEKIGDPLILSEIPCPSPLSSEVLIKIQACGVCRTDLHIIDGELPHPKLPLILGHQVVGVIEKIGENVSKHKVGDRVGVPWLGGCCGICQYCRSGKENLCEKAIYTGYTQDGGFADYCTAHEDFVLNLPFEYDDLHTAPLLCAGLIGFRAFQMAEPHKTIGFYGFGSSAHLLIQIANALEKDVYVFTRPGDHKTQEFARSLGARWAGDSDELPPVELDAAIIFAPVGSLIPEALKSIKKGGKVISAGIYMSDIPSFPYSLLWEERSISSVANLTRQDGIDFMELIKKIRLNITVNTFALEDANQAIALIRSGEVDGSIVLTMA